MVVEMILFPFSVAEKLTSTKSNKIMKRMVDILAKSYTIFDCFQYLSHIML